MTLLPYVTNNRALAIALHVAGAKIRRLRNIYTPEMLSAWGLRDPKEAVAKGRLGQLEFHIDRHEDLQRMIETYDDAATKAEDYEIPDDEPEHIQAIRIVCHAFKLRKGVESMLKNPNSAWLKWGAEKPDPKTVERIKEAMERGEEVTVSMPGFKMMQATAPQETRERLGL